VNKAELNSLLDHKENTMNDTPTPRTDGITGFFVDGSGIKKGDEFYIDPNGPFVFASFARELERELASETKWAHEYHERVKELEDENARLRAIFPRILVALKSGACSPTCSIEFMEQIPDEVRLVIRGLSLPNVQAQR
jgi:hypothetical protein